MTVLELRQPSPDEAPGAAAQDGAVAGPAAAWGRRLLPVGLRLLAVAALYALYAYARNQHGVASAAAWQSAQAHADGIVALQQWLQLPHERDLQQLVLGQGWLVRASGAYYGSAHFLVTAGLLLLLVLRRPDRLDRWGITLGVSTFAAVAVFASYPVAPPRLMPPGEATVDTLAVVGGVWSYDHGVLERISDPFAALPSLHLAWATWCALVLWSLADGSRRARAWRAAAVAHPVLTLVTVLVTGNHWYVDAVAGTALVLAVWALQRAVRERRGRQPARVVPVPRTAQLSTSAP